jgi:hypothetical protein
MANRLTEEPVMTHEQFTYGRRCMVAAIIVSFVVSFELGARAIPYCFVIPTYCLLRLVIPRIPGIWRPWPVWPSTQWRQRLDRYLDGEGRR